MKFPLLSIDGAKSESIEISDKLVKLKVNHKLIKFVIDWQLNHAKPRTAKTKQRNEIKERIIKAGHEAVNQLIKVAEEEIIKPDPDDELAADRLKNAAATKKLAIFDAFEILNRIENEKNLIENPEEEKTNLTGGFAERRSK